MCLREQWLETISGKTVWARGASHGVAIVVVGIVGLRRGGRRLVVRVARETNQGSINEVSPEII